MLPRRETGLNSTGKDEYVVRDPHVTQSWKNLNDFKLSFLTN